MDEFTLISRYFAPLASESGASGLQDDAACVTPPPGRQMVVTKDAMVAGVHFFPDDPAGEVARKLLRVNLSDLASMGAEPAWYLLAGMLPEDTSEAWVAGFAEGLRADQARYGVSLLGGDTVSTPGPLSLSLTAIGWVEPGKLLTRSSAVPGDRIYVSGTIGDAALGLLQRQGKLVQIDASHAAFLEERYRLPQPQITLGRQLPGIAHACTDISDGLAADLGHICAASGVHACIRSAQVPLSVAAAQALAYDTSLWEAVLSGGDDYELVCTVPPEKAGTIEATGAYTCIGEITPADKEGAPVAILDAEGKQFSLRRTGYRHE